MPPLDDQLLDRLLAADELPDPPASLTARVSAKLADAATAVPEQQQAWLARLQQVREEFRQLLCQPQFAGLALATRGDSAAGSVAGDDDAALGHAVQGRNIRGQIFLSALESPQGLEVVLSAPPAGQEVEKTVADELGRFRFLGLEVGQYEMAVPQLGLSQQVEIRH